MKNLVLSNAFPGPDQQEEAEKSDSRPDEGVEITDNQNHPDEQPGVFLPMDWVDGWFME
ncbi:MAG: hypothetical protein K9G62_07335 [Alphaproteobacteria bacterium]|nr:hypothetical protein [Alphaproteobacteria bacterium]